MLIFITKSLKAAIDPEKRSRRRSGREPEKVGVERVRPPPEEFYA
jgi:hypothetical protein